MQDRPVLTASQINDELLWPVFELRRRHVLAFLPPFILVMAGAIAVTILVWQGLWITGLQRPAFWGFFIVNFVFWIGVSHAGTMISSILRLTQAEWKRPITRAAEVMTVFALRHVPYPPRHPRGRPWRIIYWLLPYDFTRGIWPDVRSPLVWDPVAITTYLTGSILFVFTALIPDFAIIRDQSTGMRRTIYGMLAMGWRGTPRQWKLQGIFGILMSALILPVFVSVHSIVSWDFAVSVVPAWHVTVYAPYFVIGAVHSGVSMVLTLMALMRWIFKLENFIWEDHFDAVGRLLIFIATAWLFFFFLDFAFSFYSREEQEIAVMGAPPVPVAVQCHHHHHGAHLIRHTDTVMVESEGPPEHRTDVLDVDPGQHRYVAGEVLPHHPGHRTETGAHILMGELCPEPDGERHRSCVIRDGGDAVNSLRQAGAISAGVGTEGGTGLPV